MVLVEALCELRTLPNTSSDKEPLLPLSVNIDWMGTCCVPTSVEMTPLLTPAWVLSEHATETEGLNKI